MAGCENYGNNQDKSVVIHVFGFESRADTLWSKRGEARGVYQRDVEVKVQFSASSGTFWIKIIQMLIHSNEKWGIMRAHCRMLTITHKIRYAFLSFISVQEKHGFPLVYYIGKCVDCPKWSRLRNAHAWFIDNNIAFHMRLTWKNFWALALHHNVKRLLYCL